MLKKIINGEIYSPDFLGQKDLLLAGDKIAFMLDKGSSFPDEYIDEIIDAEGKYVLPGFIDGHVHIMGGGGEGGYKTRTPELFLSDAVSAGVTTIVGVIGTDGTTRTMPSLIAKARALEEEGITCFVHTGSYQVPVKTLTGKIEDDLILIDRIIGCGEIAISDHRSSQPTVEELSKIASQARIGGMLSGKAGIVNVHIGDGKGMLSLLEEAAEVTDLPLTTFYPTHINRNPDLFEAGILFAKKGGWVDLTTSTVPRFLEQGEVKCSKGLKRMLEAGVPLSRITFTSDAQGSLPEFNAAGELTGLQIGKVSSLFQEVRDAVLSEDIPLEKALKVITENPAAVLKLHSKGKIGKGFDADLVLCDKTDLSITDVIAKGQVMMQNKEVAVKGTFE
ncbi:beta-aspartyl-peptidase [Metabacillus sp. GX 13764]|uniref:beta-aspartyl-peptidase n=1 Tax=Metabacillus kandeliae TaxID=2900151 RepID=UPI001E64054B|nr:beta-aspartyl-peptidase [Metabacillus kandeliae]MCD7034859.1 beta-aspartyl-peptidase [Metabacillus kandeliae]